MSQTIASEAKVQSKPLITSRTGLLILGMTNIAVFSLAISWLYVFLFAEPVYSSGLGIFSRVGVEVK